MSKETGEFIGQSAMHPDFRSLLERYIDDPRFDSDEPARVACIEYLLELNEWVQNIHKPPEISAVILAGSFSSYKTTPPNLEPVIDGPRPNGVREIGGSDMDVLFTYKSDISGLLNLKWLDFNTPEREMVHPDDFVYNTLKHLRHELKRQGSKRLSNRVELLIAVLTPTLGELALKKYVRHMIKTGTLIWGDIPVASYGKFREKDLPYKRPSSDSIQDKQDGGF